MIFKPVSVTFDLDPNFLRIRTASTFERVFIPTESFSSQGVELVSSLSVYAAQIFFRLHLVVAVPDWK